MLVCHAAEYAAVLQTASSFRPAFQGLHPWLVCGRSVAAASPRRLIVLHTVTFNLTMEQRHPRRLIVLQTSV
jgi:hypothetical protein